MYHNDHDCSIDISWEADPWDFVLVEMITARKHHICGECHEHIHPKQKYERVKGLLDGKWSLIRTCERCLTLRDHYCPNGHIYGELLETISNALGSDYIETLIPRETCLECIERK